MYSPFKKEKLSNVAKVQVIGCCKWGGEYSIKKNSEREKRNGWHEEISIHLSL